MATVSDSYESIVRGVSQQVPDKRLSGQHWTQDNALSDPVRGLRRRPGTRRLTQTVVAGSVADLAENFRDFDVQANGRQLSLLVRRPGTTGASAAVYAFQRGVFGTAGDAESLAVAPTAAAAAQLAAGINAVAAVGGYVLFAHTHPVGSSRVELYGTTANQRRVAVSVKAGTYGRTYTIKIKRTAGIDVTVNYTSPNLYNGDGSVNASAAAAIQPNNIAEQLRTRLVANAQFNANYTVIRRGSTLLITPGSDLEYVNAGDAGDNTQITATWRVVQDPSDLPPTAVVGHIVQVRPRTGSEEYYLRAEADDGEPEKVVWREYTESEITLVDPFCLGYLHDDVLHVGANPADLQAALTTAGSTVEVPVFPARGVGDDDSMPAPHFVGREITDLVVFQERLLVASGPVVNASRVAGFFNFWRTTVLTYPDDDAVEMYASGSEADVIRSSVIFDRSLVFFGDKQQYAVSGKVPLTGATATIMQSSAHKDSAAVRPVALGDLLFFMKSGRHYASTYQVAVGNVDDTSNSSEVSRQLNDYVLGHGRELRGLSLPEMLVIRTSTANTLYTFTYIDLPSGERILDAWSRWTFADGCGKLAGVSVHEDILRLIFAKTVGADTVLVVDELDLNDTSEVAPHLDSWFYTGEFASDDALHCAYTGLAAASRRWFGREDNNVGTLVTEFGADAELVCGYPQKMLVRITSPNVLNNRNVPVKGGVLTVTAVTVDMDKSGGMLATTELPWGEQPGVLWSGRVIGQLDNLVGYRSLRKASQGVVIGQDAERYVLRIESLDWRPLTITGVHWKGQYFKRARSL